MYHRNGLGQGGIETVVGGIADQIVTALMPKMKLIVAEASVSAEPAVRKVLREEVLPTFGFATVLGLAALGAVAAAVGSYFATRRQSNPAGRVYRMQIRRRAA